MKGDLKVKKIEQGTVIDHLPAGSALSILDMLSLADPQPVIIAMNVTSSKYGKKDVIKIERKFLSEEETNKIGLIAPKATINIIKNQVLKDKRHVNPPDELTGLLVCPNKNCVTNSERCETKFIRHGSKYRCYFCERLFRINEFSLC